LIATKKRQTRIPPIFIILQLISLRTAAAIMDAEYIGERKHKLCLKSARIVPFPVDWVATVTTAGNTHKRIVLHCTSLLAVIFAKYAI
jgi:hypothetical protein